MRPHPRYQPGDRIGGRYQVHQALMGGMGEVYLCLDLEQMYPYALKTFQQRYLTQSQKLRAAFEQEVATWVALEKHPNIVHCCYMEFFDNRPFMVLEWIAGEEGKGADLRGWLRRGPLELRIALEIILDVVHGLLHAQEKKPGLVHRDLKPENILMAQGGLAKITDFGLAQIVEQAGLDLAESEAMADERQSLMRKGGIAGTPAYMAPEQWRGEPLDERTDIYAVGCILYELLTGEWPYQVDFTPTTPPQFQQWLRAMQTGHEVTPPPALPLALPGELSQLVGSCLAKERVERLGSLAGLLAQLETIYQQAFDQPPPGQSQPGEMTAVGYNNRGVTYDHLQRYDEALRDFNRAIKLDPNYAPAYSNRGNTYSDLQRYDEALRDFDRAIELNPNDAKAYCNRGITYAELEQYDEALRDYGRAIELDPNLAPAYSSRGNTYRRLQRYEVALHDYGRAIALDPTLAPAYFNRGNTYGALQRYDEALRDFDRVIELDPNFAQVYGNRGDTYADLQRYEEALQDYSWVIELNPNDATAYSNRGNTYAELEQYDEALRDFTQAIALDPTLALAYFKRGVTYENLQRDQEALQDFTRVIALNPDYAEAFYHRGNTYANLKQYKAALADYSRAIELDPTFALAYFMRGDTYADLQRDEEALQDFTQAIALDPTSAPAYYLRGLSRHKLQRYEEALRDYSQAIELNPTFVLAYHDRGLAHAELQEYEAALADYGQAIDLDSNYALAYSNRGNTYQALQRTEEALADYGRAIELDPSLALAYVNLGLLHGNQGRLDDALSYFDKAAQLGDPQGAQYAAQVRQMLGPEAASQPDPAQQAFEAFQQAGSVEAMRQAVGRFPFVVEAEFIAAIEQTIDQQMPPEHRSALEQRLAWLRQIAGEQA